MRNLWIKLQFPQVLALSKQDIIEILYKLPSKDREEIFSKFQNENTGNESVDGKEQYKKLQPIWFEHAPKSAKQRWKELVDSNNVEKLQWICDNVSYNADHTLNILKLKKTFCKDVSSQYQSFTFSQAQKLEKTNAWWYKLMTDYNETDTEQEKMQTDWYKLINLFSWNNGDTYEWIEFFRDMTWCDNRYWTATKHKNYKWEEVKDVVLLRKLHKSKCKCSRYWGNANTNNRVCGFKDSM